MPGIARLARALLTVGVLALVFAPGAVGSAPSETPTALAAAVLAPTTAEQATVSATTPTTEVIDALALTATVMVAVSLAVAGWRRRIETTTVPRTSPSTPGRPCRRGPPLLTV